MYFSPYENRSNNPIRIGLGLFFFHQHIAISFSSSVGLLEFSHAASSSPNFSVRPWHGRSLLPRLGQLRGWPCRCNSAASRRPALDRLVEQHSSVPATIDSWCPSTWSSRQDYKLARDIIHQLFDQAPYRRPSKRLRIGMYELNCNLGIFVLVHYVQHAYVY